MNEERDHKEVFIIDDDIGNCILMEECLSDIGIYVSYTDTVFAACKMLRTNLAITDLFVAMYVPDISELFYFLTSRQLDLRIKVFAIVTDLDRNMMKTMDLYNIREYFQKPISFDRLLELFDDNL